jgi:hypothetical protein
MGAKVRPRYQTLPDAAIHPLLFFAGILASGLSPEALPVMIELEVYAAGVRNLEKILELDHELETIPGLRYKIDSNHDIVYLEFDEPTFTIQEIRTIFRKLALDAKVVGTVPSELNPKSKTQVLGSSTSPLI